MRIKILVALVGLLTLGSAGAEIYKSVGAHNRVSYTNVTNEGKPPAGAVLQVPATHRDFLSSTLGATQVRTEAALPVPMQRVSRTGAQSETSDGSRILTPDVIGAVANVMGVAQLVSSSREFCVAALPTAYKRYSNAALGWEHRNSVVMAQKDRILSHPVQQMVAESLAADMLRKTASMMQPVRSSGTAARAEWCDKAFADVDRGALDLVGRPSIAPLMNYGRR